MRSGGPPTEAREKASRAAPSKLTEKVGGHGARGGPSVETRTGLTVSPEMETRYTASYT